MSTFPFAEILRDVNSVMFERPRDVSIKVDSLPAFTAALFAETAVADADPKLVVAAKFCGVRVMEHFAIPRGMAVITHGDEIVNIIRYAAAA